MSVRTLHYYEEIGLLTPSGRTAAGHRLHTPVDIQRLQQIRSLQQLGLPLSPIGDCLAADSFDARQTKSIYKLLHDEEQARKDHGISEELFAYLGSIVGGPEH